MFNIKIFYLFQFISNVLSKFGYGYILKKSNLSIFVIESNMYFLLYALKKNEICSMYSLLDIAVSDLLKLRQNGRFLLNYVFWNYSNEIRIIIKLFNNGRSPIRSLTGLYNSSDWLEREAWDMYGIKFLFHGNLRRILTDYGFKGHPLRKDFPLIGYIDLYYDEVLQGITLHAVETAQAFRFYEFENPWNNWQV